MGINIIRGGRQTFRQSTLALQLKGENYDIRFCCTSSKHVKWNEDDNERTNAKKRRSSSALHFCLPQHIFHIDFCLYVNRKTMLHLSSHFSYHSSPLHSCTLSSDLLIIRVVSQMVEIFSFFCPKQQHQHVYWKYDKIKFSRYRSFSLWRAQGIMLSSHIFSPGGASQPTPKTRKANTENGKF